MAAPLGISLIAPINATSQLDNPTARTKRLPLPAVPVRERREGTIDPLDGVRQQVEVLAHVQPSRSVGECLASQMMVPISGVGWEQTLPNRESA